ncbi:MAG: tetratricopeptide repeat protein, partial [Planctomycetaceae bacterium]|nr:tetratricopeptide repeat protein [Planctomycetaceae bacterium]
MNRLLPGTYCLMALLFVSVCFRSQENFAAQQLPRKAFDLVKQANQFEKETKFREAVEKWEELLPIVEASYGTDHLDVAATLGKIALLKSRLGDFEEAEAAYLRSLHIREQKLEVNDPKIAITLNNLANLYITLGRYEKAEPLTRRALNVYEFHLGNDHPDYASIMNNLAALLKAQGKYDEAETLYNRSLKIRESKLGPDHNDVAQSLHNLAALYELQGDYTRAEPFYQRALKIRQKRLGEDHPDVATSLNYLAALYFAQGRYEKAEPLYLESISILEAKLGKDHPDVAQIINNLAALYYRKSEFKKAEDFYLRSLKIREIKYGSNHPSVASSLNNLANLYSSQLDYKKAQPLYQRSLRIRELALGSGHPDVANSCNNQAGLYKLQGKFEKAMPFLDRAIKIQNENGIASGIRAKTYKLRAEIFWELNKQDEAIADLSQAMQLAEQQRLQFSGGSEDHAQAFSGYALLYEEMIKWQTERGKLAEVFSAIERSRAKSLLDQLAASGTNLLIGLSSTESARLKQQKQDAHTRLAYLEQQIRIKKAKSEKINSGDQNDLNQLSRELVAAKQTLVDAYQAVQNASPAYRLSMSENQRPVELSVIQSEVTQQQGILLEYFIGSDQSYLFVVPSKGDPQIYHLKVDET